MNELNTRLLEYLPDPNTVKGGLGGIVETMQVEAPLLVKEILLWNICMSSIYFLSALILIIALIIFMRLAFIIIKRACEDTKEEGCEYLVNFTWVVIALIVPALFLNLAWLQILIAPRLFLIEYISNLL